MTGFGLSCLTCRSPRTSGDGPPRRATHSLAACAALAALLAVPSAALALPAVQDVTVTDVTPRSFSVVWTTNEPATAGLRLFRGPDCTEQITNATITPHPTLSGDAAIRQAAELAGVMKVRAARLAPDTAYCYQTLTISKSTNEVAVFPPTPAPVRTARAVTRAFRFQAAGPLQPFSNDVARFPAFQPDQVTAASGALLLISAPGALAPVSGFIGDGIPAPLALVDLNNLFEATSGANMPLLGGEALTIRQVRGIQGGTLVRVREVPIPSTPEAPQGLAALRDPNPCFAVDLDCNGVINVIDLQRALNQVGTQAGQPGFNPDLDIVKDDVIQDLDWRAIIERFGQQKPFQP